MVEYLFILYVDEKRSEKFKIKWKARAHFKVDEGLVKEIEEKQESFYLKGTRGNRERVEKEEKSEKEERMEVDEDKERKEKEMKSKKIWVDVLDEDGKVIERQLKKRGKVKVGDFVRRTFYEKVQVEEKKEEGLRCVLCKKVFLAKKVHILEVHRHFVWEHKKEARELKGELLPGGFDCRKLWRNFYEEEKIEITEELKEKLSQKRKARNVGFGAEEQEKKRKKFGEEERGEFFLSSSLVPLQVTSLPQKDVLTKKNLNAISKKVAKEKKKVSLFLFSFYFLNEIFFE